MVVRREADRQKCESCGTETASRYEWANLTGNYDDPSDYQRMCVRCHREFDGTLPHLNVARAAVSGHKAPPDRAALDAAIRAVYQREDMNAAEVGAWMRMLDRWGWLFERRLMAMQAERRLRPDHRLDVPPAGMP